jgi:hypothetical protein
MFFKYSQRRRSLYLPKSRSSTKDGREFGEMKEPFRKCLSCYLVVAIFVMGIVPRVYAGFSPSEAVALPQFDRSADLEKIQKMLEMKMVQERLKQLGFSEDEIQSRLGQLSDQQIHQLAQTLDQLKVGGDGGGVIIFLLLVALIVVLVLYLTGTKVAVTK